MTDEEKIKTHPDMFYYEHEVTPDDMDKQDDKNSVAQ